MELTEVLSLCSFDQHTSLNLFWPASDLAPDDILSPNFPQFFFPVSEAIVLFFHCCQTIDSLNHLGRICFDLAKNDLKSSSKI